MSGKRPTGQMTPAGPAAGARGRKTGVATAPVEPGTLVWIPDTETGQVWIKAEVESIDPEKRTVRVKMDDGSVRVANLDKLLRCNTDTWKAEEGLTAVSDLSSLTHLHEPEVLQALELRFDIDKIYTNCGPILIVLNPFKLIAGLYDQFPPAQAQDNEDPHIYLIARKAYQNITEKLQSQVVLISGESGAGKTESTKHVLKFLTTQIGKMGGADTGEGSGSVLKKVLSSNPLLEAFGNACTTRNDNSSRFGKFIELQFEGRGNLPCFQCAAIDTYLLEKVRITEVQQNERSYHIFYQACAAAQRFGQAHRGLPLHLFDSPSSFIYLSKSDRVVLDSNDDAELFEETLDAMEAMGISAEEQVQIIQVVAAVLHIGNIPMREKSSQTEIPPEDRSFQLVSQLLGIQPEALAKAFTYRLISVSASEKYDSPLTLAQSESLRESFARALYSLLFNFLVYRVNKSLAGNVKSGGGKKFFGGVLDIFGFEHFEKNSFEQLCINFANERLQQLFNQFVFKMEMDLYQKENVVCDFTDFPDNQDIIDMIQAKSCSIFTLLDEECRLPKGSDQAFVQKLWKTFDKNVRFRVEPRKPTSFSVVHFAGTVSYDTAHFMEKNMDELGELLKQAMESSETALVKAILNLKREKETSGAAPTPPKPGMRAGGKLKPNTVSTDFKTQLEFLMQKMGSACPHFVRCIKPNPEKRADKYDRQSVAEQLRSGGVIEALCVQRAGFPCRWTHKECWENISIMFKVQQRAQFKQMQVEERIKLALSTLSKDMKLQVTSNVSFAIGKTKVFFKQGPFEALESERIRILNEAATRLQSGWKRYLFRRIFRMIYNTIAFLQAAIRRYLARKKLWDNMAPEVRRRSLLFKVHFKDLAPMEPRMSVIKDTGDEEEEDGLSDVSEVWAPGGEGEKVESARNSKAALEVMELRNEKEELERRIAEEKDKATASAMAVEKERKRLSEEMQKMEQRYQAEQAAAKTEHDQEIRRMTVKFNTEKEEEVAKRDQVEKELQVVRRDVDVRKAEYEQQMTLVQLREQEAKSRVDELQREIKRLRDEIAAQAERHAIAISELHAAHVQALAHAADQHEAQRQTYLKQIDEMRESMDEAHSKQQEASRNQEQEHAQRFRSEVQQIRDRETQQRVRHEEELANLRQKEIDRGRRWQAELAEAKRNESDTRLQIQVMEQQLLDLKADNEQHRKLVEAQQEETKRMHANQIEMLESRHQERERNLQKELEMCTSQKSEQVSTLRGQLEFQKRELVMTCQQEVEMIKHQWEQRERQLMQMLNQARMGQAEREKTAEVQLALKAQQQDELHRCADAKARHLEESARRQQELYEQHVEQLTQQMRESQESFRRQLEEAQAQNDERLAASVGQLATLEAQIKEDQEKRRAQEECEREDTAFKLAEMSKLQERNQSLEAANKALQEQLREALTSRPRKSRVVNGSGSFLKTDSDGESQPKLTRRLSEPVPKLVRGASDPTDRKSVVPMRLLLGPKRMSMAIQAPPGPGGSPTARESSIRFAEQPKLERKKSLVMDGSGMGGPRKSISDLMGGARANARASIKPDIVQSFRFLRPTVLENGEPSTGEVGAWRQIAGTPASLGGRQGDAAITVLTFADVEPDAKHWLLAAASKSGSLAVYNVKRTALERGASPLEDATDSSADVEAKVQFIAHAKAITSMSFSKDGKELMTTSSDWHVRIWLVQDGTLKNRFVDSSLVVCALPMPGSDWSMVMANAGAVLRLISNEGQKQQKVRLDHYARSLVLAFDGARLLAGTSRGHIHALDVDSKGLRIVGKQQVSSGAALTCLVVAPCGDGMPPLVVANSMDNTVCVLQANAQMTNFTVLKRLPNPHKLLPLRCCHVPSFDETSGLSGSGAGFIASASEDSTVHVIDLDGFQEMRLTGHSTPVVDVASTGNSGLLASGDVHGRIILWRRGGRAASGNPSAPRGRGSR